MTTFASLYGGFGGADCGARAAGLDLTWSIEHETAVAEVAHANLHHRVYVRDILDCDPKKFDRVDVFHASPPCTSMSLANPNAGETALDIALARKTAEFVSVLLPACFTLENVWAYRRTKSWGIIQDALHKTGYWVSVEHCNAADYSVPQTRKRMIMRAVRGGFVPYLPEPSPWVGWYAAVEDLLDTLPESQFAPWQLARLPELLATTLVGVGGYHVGITMVKQPEPSMTVTSNENMLTMRAFLVGDQERQLATDGEPAFTVRAGEHGGAMPKAWLVDSTNASKTGQLTIREDEQPSFTVTSGGPKHPTRSLLSSGRVVAMTPRCLARFQSFPDWYSLPDNARLAARGVGNAVPPLLYQRIITPLLEDSCTKDALPATRTSARYASK